MSIFWSFCCALLWAATGVLVRSLQGIGVWQVIFWRMAIAAITVMLITGLFTPNNRDKSRRLRSLSAEQWALSALMTLYYICATFAFVLAPVALAALIVALSPCITFICRLYDGDRLSRSEIFGFLLALLGLYLFLFPPAGQQTVLDSNTLLGALLALVSATTRALYSYRIWKLTQHGIAVPANLMSLATLLLGLLPCALVIGFSGGSLTPVQMPEMLTTLLALGILSTALPTLINGQVSGRISPSLHSLIGMTIPLFAALLAWIWLGDTLSFWQISGMALSLAGIIISLI